MTRNVKVKHLQRGDYLPATNRTVVSVGYSPATGTKAVVLQRDGEKHTHIAIWRAETTVGVLRKDGE